LPSRWFSIRRIGSRALSAASSRFSSTPSKSSSRVFRRSARARETARASRVAPRLLSRDAAPAARIAARRKGGEAEGASSSTSWKRNSNFLQRGLKSMSRKTNNPRTGARTWAPVAALLVLLCLASAARAQQLVGNVFGYVTDEQGGRLPGVTVTLSGVGAP